MIASAKYEISQLVHLSDDSRRHRLIMPIVSKGSVMKYPFIAMIGLVIAAAACAPNSNGTPIDDIFSETQEALEATQTSLAATAEGKISEQTDLGHEETPEVMPCSDAGRYLGKEVTCMIRRAYCSYRPDIKGSPTFCNDAPYPGHEFTLLVWEQDWSEFDGECLLVTGILSRYKGKLEIIAESRSAVQRCR